MNLFAAVAVLLLPLQLAALTTATTETTVSTTTEDTSSQSTVTTVDTTEEDTATASQSTVTSTNGTEETTAATAIATAQPGKITEADSQTEEVDMQLMNAAINAGYWIEKGNRSAGYVAWNCQALCNSHQRFMKCCNAIMGTNEPPYSIVRNLCSNDEPYVVPCGLTEDQFLEYKKSFK